jgi:hypothetical protein
MDIRVNCIKRNIVAQIMKDKTVSAVQYLFSTNPLLSMPRSSFEKWGSVRCVKPYLMRLPCTFCCPTQAIICEILSSDPLEPAITVPLMALRSTERERMGREKEGGKRLREGVRGER